MHLKYPETIPPYPWSVEKLSSSPWCQKGWGLLIWGFRMHQSKRIVLAISLSQPLHRGVRNGWVGRRQIRKGFMF